MNYPTGVKKIISGSKQIREYKNLGMNLENDINSTNDYYIKKEIMEYIKVNILILRRKKQLIKLVFH